MSLVRARVFAEMVQDAFTQALGEGICTVSVTGAGEGDVKEVSFEARFNLPAGIVFGLDGGILDHDDANLREGAAQVSASLSQDISREVLAMATALLQADVQTFRASPEAAAHQATADMVDEALEQLVSEGLVEVVEAPKTPRSQIATKVFEALGEASSCWSNLGGAGVFNSTRAKEIGERLMLDIDRYTEELGQEVSPDDPSGSTAAAGDGVSVPRVDGP